MELQILKRVKWIIIGTALLTSCRKDVTLKMPDYEEKIVIEASIETGAGAVVLLSRSVPYFGEFNFSTPEKSFVKGATVVVTDGVIADTLQELDPNLGYIYFGGRLIGKENTNYRLKVTVDGKTFETETRISTAVPLDSLFFKPEKDDSLGLIHQKFSEPAGSGDCYRWMAKRLGRDQFYAAPWGSVFEDKFVDGKTFEFAYDRGPQPNQLQQYREDPERGFYKRGDTVVVKFSRIGRREYEFWYSYYQNKISNANPFSAPANIKSTFEDFRHVFGSFTGYATAFDTIVIPRQ